MPAPWARENPYPVTIRDKSTDLRCDLLGPKLDS